MTDTMGFAALFNAATFRQLLAEQTTPAEMVNFVAVVVVGALLVAAVVYAVLMTAIWAVRLRPRVRYGALFLPTRQQFVEYAGEYLLALGTSVLLSLTLLTRHALVEEILSHSLHEDHATQIQLLLPHLGDPTSAIRGGTVAGVFLKPLLEEGREADAYAIATSVVSELGEARLSAFPTRNALLFVCAGMMIAYLAWLVRGRYRELREPKPDEPAYARTARGLLTLAACIALLLLAPTLDRGVEAAADGVVAAAGVRDLPPSADSVAMRVREAIEADREAGGPMRRADLDALRRSVATMTREHSSMHLALRELNALRAWQDSMRLVTVRWSDFDKRLTTLEAWHGNGTLLVFAPATATYHVRSAAGGAPVASIVPGRAPVTAGRVTSARAVARGVRVYEVRLAPGSYRISRDSAGREPIDSVAVQAGGIAVSFLLP